MANSWFRFYAEFEDDPKVQMMPENMQRRLAMLFCERCKEEKRTEAQRAFKWHISMSDLSETKTLFLELGFIDDKWNLENWNKRQFLSDSSTDRVRKFRAKQGLKHGETLQVVTVKQSVTPPDTDTDTEQKQRKEEPPAVFRLPALKGEEFLITQEKLDLWAQIYPAIDVNQEVRGMIGWLDGNRNNWKTLNGMPRFVNRWLSGAQNRAKPYAGGNGYKHDPLAGMRFVGDGE